MQLKSKRVAVFEGPVAREAPYPPTPPPPSPARVRDHPSRLQGSGSARLRVWGSEGVGLPVFRGSEFGAFRVPPLRTSEP